jgi:hypothetical protein
VLVDLLAGNARYLELREAGSGSQCLPSVLVRASPSAGRIRSGPYRFRRGEAPLDVYFE